MPWESRPVQISANQKRKLKKIANSPSSSNEERIRALIVLLLGEGLKNKEIVQRLGVHENTVVKWRGRWTGSNKDAHVGAYGKSGGRPRSALTADKLEQIAKTTKTRPPKGRKRWSVRTLADAVKLPVATTQRALVELGIQLSKH